MSETFLGFRNELTKFMDKNIKESSKYKGFYVYILEGKDGKPDVYEGDDFYGWYIRYPGYTCANVLFSKKDDTVIKINITYRGGGFSGGNETIFIDPKKLKKELEEKFKGKKLSYETDKYDREKSINEQ